MKFRRLTAEEVRDIIWVTDDEDEDIEIVEEEGFSDEDI